MSTHTPKPALYWLPNSLTLGRIIFIPILVIGLLSYSTDIALMGRGVLVALFIIMIATDFLDGYLARRLGVTSDFGRMIDPIADKLFVAALLITFSIMESGHPLLLAPALIIIGRDIFVSGLREHAALEGIVMPPTKLAKWKTATEMLALGALLLALIYFRHTATGEIFRQTGIAILWVASSLSTYTGAKYLRATLKSP